MIMFYPIEDVVVKKSSIKLGPSWMNEKTSGSNWMERLMKFILLVTWLICKYIIEFVSFFVACLDGTGYYMGSQTRTLQK